MVFKKNEIEFESDKVKVYVQQLQAENALLRQANEEKNELLIKLGYPTKATAKRKVLCLQQQLDQLKAENEILEKVNKANQEKIKKLNEQLENEFIAKQYGDEALFFTLINIKEICENNDELKGDFNLVDCDKYKLGKHNLAKKILEEIKVVIDE